jgi:hypothetical protein
VSDEPIIRAAKSRIERERDFTMHERSVYPPDSYDVGAALRGEPQPQACAPRDQQRRTADRRLPGARRHPDFEQRQPGRDRRQG